MIGKVISTALKQSVDVSALFGDRIYPVIIPQDTDTLPAITYQITNLNAVKSKSATVTLDGDIDITIYCKTYSELQDAVIKVILALDRNIITKTVDAQYISYFSYQSYNEGFEEDREVYTAELNFYVRKPYNNE